MLLLFFLLFFPQILYIFFYWFTFSTLDLYFFLIFFNTDFIITNQEKYYVKLREVFHLFPSSSWNKPASFSSHLTASSLVSPLLSSLPCRCSSCSSSADKASSGSRSGTCLCLTRRKRRSPESWCRQFWPASPRCAASWSGETSRLSTRGGLGGFGGGGEKWEHFCGWTLGLFHSCMGNSATCHSPTQSTVRESVITERQWENGWSFLPHYDLVTVPARKKSGRLLVNPCDPAETLPPYCAVTNKTNGSLPHLMSSVRRFSPSLLFFYCPQEFDWSYYTPITLCYYHVVI